MSSSSRIFVHIGLPKCGSSYLQAQFLPHLEQTGALRYVNVQRLGEPMRRLGFEDPATFDPKAFRSALEPFTDREVTVITVEWLSGAILHKSFNRTAVANKLRRALPEATVLLVLRSQPELVMSTYRQYVHQGGVLDLRTFAGFDGTALHDDYSHAHYRFDDHRISLPSLRFQLLFDDYSPFAEAGRLKTLLFEQLRADPQSFGAQLLRILKLDPAISKNIPFGVVNRGYGRTQIALARRLNRLLRSPYNPHGLHLPNPLNPRESMHAAQLRRVLQSDLAFELLDRGPLKDQALYEALKRYYVRSNTDLSSSIPPELIDLFRKHYLWSI